MAFPPPRSIKNYDDKFDDVMHYVEMRLNEKGVKYKLRDKKDMQTLLERFNALEGNKRKNNGENHVPKMSDSFINRILGTKRATQAQGVTIGQYGSTYELRRETTTTTKPQSNPKIQSYRQQGRQVYRYDGQYAVRALYKRREKQMYRFRNVTTGRFISKADAAKLEEDEE